MQGSLKCGWTHTRGMSIEDSAEHCHNLGVPREQNELSIPSLTIVSLLLPLPQISQPKGRVAIASKRFTVPENFIERGHVQAAEHGVAMTLSKAVKATLQHSILRPEGWGLAYKPMYQLHGK